jgi:hypothetical protein
VRTDATGLVEGDGSGGLQVRTEGGRPARREGRGEDGGGGCVGAKKRSGGGLTHGRRADVPADRRRADPMRGGLMCERIASEEG